MSDATKNSPARKQRDKKPRVDKEIFDPEEYVLRKRLPPRSSTGPNDVYVNNKTDFKAQLARCFKRLETQPFVAIRGLGAAAPKAINLALQLQLKSAHPLDIEADTTTIGVIDDLEPIYDSGDIITRERKTSAVILKVSKIHSSNQAPSS